MHRAAFLRSLLGLPLLFGAAAPARPHPRPLPAGGRPDDEAWARMRDLFPLSRERIYLNTAGLGASPQEVIDTVARAAAELERAGETGHDEALWAEIKKVAGGMLGCDPAELAFTRNATEGINIVANGLPLGEGDEVILTTEEHVGNAVTWVALAGRARLRLRRFVPSVRSEAENLERIGALLTPRTRLIAVPHVATTTGLVLPVRAIADLARPKGVWLFVDGAQGPGAVPVDLHASGCDAYATSGHKWLLGPKETGLLYVRAGMLDTVAAKHVGAYSTAAFDFAAGTLQLHPGARRYEYGTVSVPLRRGLGAALSFLDTIGLARVLEHDMRLADEAMRGLRVIPGVRLLSPEVPGLRAPIVSFSHAALDTPAMLAHLEKARIRARGVWEGGMSGVRVSFHVHNSPAEVGRLLEAVAGAGR